MTNSILKTFAIALAASGIVLSASASSMEEKFEVSFTIDPSASVAENYAEFERVAHRACKPTAMLSVIRAHPRSIRACEADLIDKVVAKAGNPALTAHHQGQGQQAETARETSEG
jgi:hypothetical protein